MIVTLSMEQGYQQLVRCYLKSKIIVTKTCYPYGTKFCGLQNVPEAAKLAYANKTRVHLLPETWFLGLLTNS